MTNECCDECNGDYLSDCCGAKYNDDTGICYECHEHADAAGCSDEDCECHQAPDKESQGDVRDHEMRDRRAEGEL